MSKSEIYLAEAVFRVISERRKIVLDALQFNSVKDMEHYKQLMGEMEALEYVENEIKDLLSRQYTEDDLKWFGENLHRAYRARARPFFDK